MTDEKSRRSEAIGGAIRAAVGDDEEKSQAESESESEPQEQSQTQSQSESQTQSQSQKDAVMQSLGADTTGEDDLKSSKKHVNMYLDEDLAEALDDRFAELDTLHEQQHGRGIQKNRDFYPALIEAAFRDDVSIVDLLDIEL